MGPKIDMVKQAGLRIAALKYLKNYWFNSQTTMTRLQYVYCLFWHIELFAIQMIWEWNKSCETRHVPTNTGTKSFDLMSNMAATCSDCLKLFQLLHQNYLSSEAETWYTCSYQYQCTVSWSNMQHGCQGFWLAETISDSQLNPLEFWNWQLVHVPTNSGWVHNAFMRLSTIQVSYGSMVLYFLYWVQMTNLIKPKHFLGRT